MERDPVRQSDRFARFCDDVIDPAVYRGAVPLGAEAFQCNEAVSLERAQAASFSPVEPGWEWGPAWSTCWFRLAGPAPDEIGEGEPVLRFDTGVESQLWMDGRPVQGFDVNRDTARVPRDSLSDGRFVCLVEAACNHPFGAGRFPWDPPDTVRRWQGERPARLIRAELAVLEADVWELAAAYRFALQLLRELPADSSRAGQLIGALGAATRAIDDRDVAGSARRALEIVEETLRSGAGGSATICHAAGHAHLDTAWLWPIRETRRKCLRSFSNVLRLMERFPEFRFVCSQAQQYAFVEQDSPELFEQIRERVREGRWEPGGAMWVEPDANCPSGESLVRQIMHGTAYWSDRFGAGGAQRYVYLPDTFGFAASLPQIIREAGLDTFITNKLAWNPVNQYPHTTFRWRGIDGTEVLTHLTPGADYNAVNTPLELRRGESRHLSTHRRGSENAARWLQPFGYGDGGGGPTDRSVRFAELAADCDGLPRTRLSRVDSFCEALHTDVAADESHGNPTPVWDGELYLDLHRGTLTTQAWLKRANRRAEELLSRAETLLAFDLAGVRPGGLTDEARDAMDEAWKLVLLNQFHDILPGSSIGEVYVDARRDHERIRELVEPIADAGLERWRAAVGAPIVFNPTSWRQSGVVDVGGEPRLVRGVPALGVSSLVGVSPGAPVRIEAGRVLDNGVIRVAIGDDGAIESLLHLASGREIALAGARPLNSLEMLEDRPRMWDAWDIDPEAETKPVVEVGEPSSIEVSEEGPLRCAIRVVRAVGLKSRVEQRYVLEAESPAVRVESRVSWREQHRTLRALFPVDVRATSATYDIQFGSVERPTHRNTEWDRAKYEVCAHRWMDVSEPGFGVALLNDGKYGHGCHGSVMSLTLLRGPTWPDPRADQGDHEFAYAIMPHPGGWREAGIIEHAAALNTPLLVCGNGEPAAGDVESLAPFEVTTDGAACCEVVACKPAESGAGAIVRLVERHGGRGSVRIAWSSAVASVERVDLLERPVEAGAVVHDAASSVTTVPVGGFQILTLRVR